MIFPDIKIDKDIPPPSDGKSLKGGYYGMLNCLEVNESFEFSRHLQSSYSTAASAIKKRTGKIFTVRKTGQETCRAWRLS